MRAVVLEALERIGEDAARQRRWTKRAVQVSSSARRRPPRVMRMKADFSAPWSARRSRNSTQAGTTPSSRGRRAGWCSRNPMT
jgi:hypothetical protein